MRNSLLIGSALAVLGFSGLVHGFWTDRWSAREDLTDAAARLEKVPMMIGPWQGKALELKDDPHSGLAGTLGRVYTHAGTGQAVTLFLACGRPGPVGKHTPDVCYQSVGYQMDTPRRFVAPAAQAGAGGPKAELFTAHFSRKRNDGQTHLRLFWGWRAGETWQAAENPRLAFAREAVVHKMYLIRELATADEPVDIDPCVGLLQELLPALQRTFAKDVPQS